MKRFFFYAMIIVMGYSLYSCKSSRPYQQPDAAVSASDGLTGKYWKLVEVMGRPVTASPAHIQFKTDGTVSGSLGCNTFSGSYAVPQAMRIQFSQCVTTLKMCIDMSLEDDLKQVLEKADSYSLSGNQLILNRARMAPLARFETVYM